MNGLMGKKRYVYEQFIRYATVYNLPLDCTINCALQSVWFENEKVRSIYCAFTVAFELGCCFGANK